MTVTEPTRHLADLSMAEALLGNRICPCGRRVERVGTPPAPISFSCPVIREQSASDRHE